MLRVNRHAEFRVSASLRESGPLTAKPAVSRWRSRAHSVWSGFGSRWHQWPGTHRRRRAPHCCNAGQQFLLCLFWTRRWHGSRSPPPPILSTPHPSVFHSGQRRSASNTGGTPQRSKCVKCAWNEKNKFWIRGESTCGVRVVTSVYVQVPFMKMKLALKKERKKTQCNKVDFNIARLNTEQLPRTKCTRVFCLPHKNSIYNNSFQLIWMNICFLLRFPHGKLKQWLTVVSQNNCSSIPNPSIHLVISCFAVTLHNLF